MNKREVLQIRWTFIYEEFLKFRNIQFNADEAMTINMIVITPVEARITGTCEYAGSTGATPGSHEHLVRWSSSRSYRWGPCSRSLGPRTP